MSTFDDRKDSFVQGYAISEELQFRAAARRNRLLGEWAAEKLGMTGEQAKEYSLSIVRTDFDEPGEEDVFAKIRADFDAGKVEQSDHQIRRVMAELMEEAVRQVKAGE
ncbi:DUF1476 domain-containing protein [Breoghania sp.]|uniref:DUF1476 domain-containing protein n=1 Tax=Breoghania sp. TaxID=2065378 RepID=UPI002AABEACF|nr:DUF1476 domain-containing protein [Breoghania sp.]